MDIEAQMKLDQLEFYLTIFYPNLPRDSRNDMLAMYLQKQMHGRLPEVAGILASNHARHVFTDYESRLREVSDGCPSSADRRRLARRAVEEQHNELLRTWRKGAPVYHPELGKIRRKFKVRYKRLKKLDATEQMTRRRLLVTEENDALANFCHRWLMGHYSTIFELSGTSNGPNDLDKNGRSEQGA